MDRSPSQVTPLRESASIQDGGELVRAQNGLDAIAGWGGVWMSCPAQSRQVVAATGRGGRMSPYLAGIRSTLPVPLTDASTQHPHSPRVGRRSIPGLESLSRLNPTSARIIRPGRCFLPLRASLFQHLTRSLLDMRPVLICGHSVFPGCFDPKRSTGALACSSTNSGQIIQQEFS